MGKNKGNDADEDEPGILDAVTGRCVTAVRACLGRFSSSKPPEPSAEVVDLLKDMKITPRLVIKFHQTFKALKASDSITMRIGADETSTVSMTRLVKNHREWVAKIMILLLDLAGFRDKVTWDGFLYVCMQFCALSKLELAQVMFYIICKEMKSWTVHYLTSSQLEEFYDDYYDCPIPAFNTKPIDFAKLPLAKYHMQDFIELSYRFSQLINPCMHLQRSMQQSMPSLRFWDDYDNIRTYNRKITIDFFRFKKVSTLLEIIKRQNGTSTGPLQQYINTCLERYDTVNKAQPNFDDHEVFKTAVLKASALCRPQQNGVLPLPLGVAPPPLTKLQREFQFPDWMHRYLEANEIPGPLGGKSIGHAKELDDKKRERVPKVPVASTKLLDEAPKTVEEAEALVRATFGEIALKSRIKEIATALFHHAAKPRSDAAKQADVVRSQELEFIRKSRQDIDPPNLVSMMHKLFREELISRVPMDVANQPV
eukprot:TRINITY_DN79313_c0_g1_i1.p1 TRINITY_DN79313_c0_g1~~TRINITY_DN79313_c0_g1_i1.p1  ORF type:complete len:482 (+),score=112.67 TRINITY_DN79313_c0_g1_i1:116-1561(+)